MGPIRLGVRNASTRSRVLSEIPLRHPVLAGWMSDRAELGSSGKLSDGMSQLGWRSPFDMTLTVVEYAPRGIVHCPWVCFATLRKCGTCRLG